ncbi:MAG: helicase-related protein [Aquificaceae bacterium]|nr:helicase-related protein [Aquificaceae bacterium]
MGEVVNVRLLAESSYSLNPPSGKLLYILGREGRVREEDLIPSSSVDPLIPYPMLNPLQTLFYKLYSGGTALIASPTSSGKSLLAYLFMKDLKGRVVYTAPTRALVREKAVEFRRYYPRDVEMRTGESVIENFKNPRGKVVVSTYEHLAYAFRNSASWIHSVEAVVVDEVHQASKRWILEEVITACLRKDIPMLCLSATLPGIEDLSRWVDAKLVIESAWRPVPLHRDVRRLMEFEPVVSLSEGSSEETMAGRLFNALFSLRNSGDKVILFVHKKSLGWKILELANQEKVGIMNQTLPFDAEEGREPEIAFHNADVPKKEREEIEEAFRNRNLNTLIATQTLAYGVNLPADRVIIMVKFIKKPEGTKIMPDSLDILQMEGRAGRLGIKEEGYSHLIVYGAKGEELQRELRESLNAPFKTALMDYRNNLDALSFFLLLAHMYEGKNYKSYLKKTYSFAKVGNKTVEQVEEFLRERGYLQSYTPTDKGLFCIKTGIPPTRFEEFLRRKSALVDLMATVRPLLHMRKFESLFDFLKRKERFEQDMEIVRGLILPCGKGCYQDNTDQFLFYTKGLTARYANVKHPPGEFSYLATDALHLMRNLLEIKAQGFYTLKSMDIIKIAHSVKYGIEHEYASLVGIKGIGHIRANLLKEVILEVGITPPDVCSPTEEFLEKLSGFEEALLEKFISYREFSQEKAREELKKVSIILQNNAGGYMVDDKILLAFGLFTVGADAFRFKKSELIQLLREVS